VSHLATTDSLFFGDTGLSLGSTERLVAQALANADDGELFLEYRSSEALAYDDGKLKTASYDLSQGFGLRAVAGETTGYAHASEMSEAALKRAADTVSAVARGYSGSVAVAPQATNRILYGDGNPLEEVDFAEKVRILEAIDRYARVKDPRVSQVSASVMNEWQAVQIVRADGGRYADVRPLIRVNVSITVKQGDKMESGSHGCGGRSLLLPYLAESAWQAQVDEALRQALVKLDAVPAPAGEMPVVLGSGWPGVMLHEAVGHGLEGDFNRKKTSAFAGLMGEMVASPGVTVVDDGTIADRRGSITIDDEGTPSQRTVLIEDGRLVGFMQDRQNARLMGVAPTGNGRRMSYAHVPMPRMTNTYALSGTHDPAELIAGVKRGLYATNFGGGSVDITNGKFVFSASEAYLIEDGRITAPVKDATLVGNGPDALTKVTMVANDMQLDEGIGTCGKNGQGVPVGVGQPSMLLSSMTVGGTAA
jgi:TldD protein